MVFTSYVLPPVVGYFVMAVLVVTPRTRALRLVLWPVFTSFAWRAAVNVDLSLGEPNRKFCNLVFVFLMTFIIARTFDWSTSELPLVWRLHPTKDSQSTIIGALDLAFTLRGYGWDWSHGVYIPCETRPTSREGFTLYTILSGVVHAIMSVILHRAIVSFSPLGIGALSGGTIFDDTLVYYARYLRATIISVLAAFAVYTSIQMSYDAGTVVGVLIFGQDPTLWPPAFDAPWRATSLSEFWGRRWHQFFRRMFLVQGGYPLAFFFGRTGLVAGAFLSSAVMHHIPLTKLSDELPPWWMLAGFGMMAPGILAERVFKRWTGRKVGGWIGWVWTMAWLILWGTAIVEGFARAGIFGHLNFTEGMPGQVAVTRMVAHVDRWLSAM